MKLKAVDLFCVALVNKDSIKMISRSSKRLSSKKWTTVQLDLRENHSTDTCLSQRAYRFSNGSENGKVTSKDKLRTILLSGLVFEYICGDIRATHYGKTKLHTKLRIYKHLGVSHITGKKVSIDNNKLIAIHEHLLCCD